MRTRVATICSIEQPIRDIYLVAAVADLAAIESEVEKLDAEIDARVYELYGLTKDEIKIVEQAVSD